MRVAYTGPRFKARLVPTCTHTWIVWFFNSRAGLTTRIIHSAVIAVERFSPYDVTQSVFVSVQAVYKYTHSGGDNTLLEAK